MGGKPRKVPKGRPAGLARLRRAPFPSGWGHFGGHIALWDGGWEEAFGGPWQTLLRELGLKPSRTRGAAASCPWTPFIHREPPAPLSRRPAPLCATTATLPRHHLHDHHHHDHHRSPVWRCRGSPPARGGAAGSGRARRHWRARLGATASRGRAAGDSRGGSPGWGPEPASEVQPPLSPAAPPAALRVQEGP